MRFFAFASLLFVFVVASRCSGVEEAKDVDLQSDGPAPYDPNCFRFQHGNVSLVPGGSGFKEIIVEDVVAKNIRISVAPPFVDATLMLPQVGIAEGGISNQKFLLRVDCHHDADAAIQGTIEVAAEIDGATRAVSVGLSPDLRAVQGVDLYLSPARGSALPGTDYGVSVLLNPVGGFEGAVTLLVDGVGGRFDPGVVTLSGVAPAMATFTAPMAEKCSDVTFEIVAKVGKEEQRQTCFVACDGVPGPVFEVSSSGFVPLVMPGETATYRIWADPGTSLALVSPPAGVTGEQAAHDFLVRTDASINAGPYLLELRGTKGDNVASTTLRLLVVRSQGPWPHLGPTITPPSGMTQNPELGFDAGGNPILTYLEIPNGLTYEALFYTSRYADGIWTPRLHYSKIRTYQSVWQGEVGWMIGDTGETYLRWAKLPDTPAMDFVGDPGETIHTDYALAIDPTGQPTMAYSCHVTNAHGMDQAARLFRLRTVHVDTPALAWTWKRYYGPESPNPVGVLGLLAGPNGEFTLAFRESIGQVLTMNGTYESLDVTAVAQQVGGIWKRLGDPWQGPPMLSLAANGSRPSLAQVTSDGRGELLEWTGTNWTQAAPPVEPTAGYLISELELAFDPLGRAVLAILELGPPQAPWAAGNAQFPSSLLRVFRLEGEAWVLLGNESVNLDPNDAASNVSLALDSSGRPHVAWQEAGHVMISRYAGE